jgi:hypothetical protein
MKTITVPAKKLNTTQGIKMAISGIQNINVGLQNESIGSDSLYTAFNKTQTNFTTLFACASPYVTFTGGTGITVTSNSTIGTVGILNTGVTSIIAGTGVVISGSSGAVTISSTGGGVSGTVTSVGLTPVSSSRLSVTNTPITASGNIAIDLVTTGVTAGSYTYPTVEVDTFGRVLAISNAASVGTVTSVGLVAGSGISVANGPITTAGDITVTNTGVTRLSAGTGISISGSTGNVTITSTAGTVSSVGISSASLVVSSSPITTAGSITVELPTNMTITGNITGANLNTTGQLTVSSSQILTTGGAANLLTSVSYFSTSAASTATLGIGTAFQTKTFAMVDENGAMVITVLNAGWKTSGAGTITFSSIGTACQLQYMNNKWICIGNNGAVFG